MGRGGSYSVATQSQKENFPSPGAGEFNKTWLKAAFSADFTGSNELFSQPKV